MRGLMKYLIMFLSLNLFADVKISNLSAVSPPQVTASAVFPMVNSSTTYKMKISEILQTPMTCNVQPSGAQTATLLLAPTSGNPYRWIKVQFNGDTMIIPAWLAP